MKEKKVKKKSGKKSTSKNKEKVCETFEIEKDGKEKIVKTCGEETKEHSNKKQIASQNKTLTGFLLFMGVVIFGILIVYGIYYSIYHFEHEGVDFDIVDSNEVTFYHTDFVINMEDYDHTQNVYLREDPRKIDIPFEGTSKIREMIVIHSDDNLACEGYGAIATYNMQQTFGAMGMQMIKDPNATCDDQGRYIHINLVQGEENKIEEYSPACYNLVVKDCDVIKVTERYLFETIKKFN
jgi:hypothetical protein